MPIEASQSRRRSMQPGRTSPCLDGDCRFDPRNIEKVSNQPVQTKRLGFDVPRKFAALAVGPDEVRLT